LAAVAKFAPLIYAAWCILTGQGINRLGCKVEILVKIEWTKIILSQTRIFAQMDIGEYRDL
jgi:hypothetical protein